MADRNDIRLWNNAAGVFAATLTTGGVVRDLTGWSFKTQVRASASATDVLAELSTANGKHAVNDPATDGRLFYDFTAAVDAGLAPGTYVYDTLGTPSGGEPELLTWGQVRVSDGVTIA